MAGLEWLLLARRKRAQMALRFGIASVLASVGLGFLTYGLIQGVQKKGAHPTPTVTVTRIIREPAPAVPHPTPTVIRYVAVSGSGGNANVWVALAAVGTAVAGLGTLALGFAGVAALRRRQPDRTDSPPEKTAA